jgi:oxygen-independent coproporphyrinogen-3 oxidase
LSVYILEIHENSEIDFLRRRRPGLFPGEEAQRRRYLRASRRLREAGFEHYEISNFCLPNRASRHNLKYWRCRPTLGFGPAAHSLFGGRRWRHRADLTTYLETPRRLEEVRCDLAVEKLFLGLRLETGVEVARLQAVTRVSSAEFDRRVGELASLVELDGSRIRLSRQGWVVSTAVLGELLAEGELLAQSRGSRATRSISTRAPFGNAATSTVDRAGR